MFVANRRRLPADFGTRRLLPPVPAAATVGALNRERTISAAATSRTLLLPFMKLVRGLSGVCLLVFALAATVSAHPAPFSYVDVELTNGSLNLTIVAHSFDLAHDLAIEPAQRLLDPAFVTSQT